MDYLVEAYLDDYQRITVEIKRRFHNGDCHIFYAQLNEQLYPLSIQNKYEYGDKIRYELTYDFILEIGQEYDIVIRDGYRVPLQYRFIVKTKRFNEEFYYDGNDLGVIVDKNKTSFKVWAPTASNVHLVIGSYFYAMSVNKGVYSVVIDQDLTGMSYQYLIKVNGNTYLTNDPYAKASLPNNKASVITNNKPVKLSSQTVMNYRDAIIYEASVRDFSKEGTFNSFDEQYLKELGITHLQLLPIEDFATVDEYHKDVFYNWGYDPLNYQCLEGSYSSDVSNPLQVITDFANLVNRCHQNNIKINLDIVFNHHYNSQVSSFNRLVPYYYFRYNGDQLSDGTYCGNEFDSQQSMMRKYILDTLCYYVQTFDIDGFRFDLMNFIDIRTMQIVQEELHKIKPSIMLYGEGWNMDTILPQQQRSSRDNKILLDKTAFFNDHFRDTMLGNIFDLHSKGYLSNNVETYQSALNCLCNSEDNLINYVQCHDNYTAFDKLRVVSVDDETAIKRMLLANGIVLLSFGIPFIGQYQEHALSKNGLANCYNVSDEINKLCNHPLNERIYRFVKDTIMFRKNSKFYQLQISDCCTDNGVIIIKVDKFTIIINPTQEVYRYQIQQEKELILDINGLTRQKVGNTLLIEAVTLVVLEG